MLGVGVDVGDGVLVAVLAAVAEPDGFAAIVCVEDGSDDNVPGMEQAKMARIMNTIVAYLLKSFFMTTSMH